MQLWTWHKPNFSLLDDRVDHSKSKYYQTVDGVKEAYIKLTERLNTDQFIWCYTIPGLRKVHPHDTEVEWILDVPSSKIIAFLDDIVWNRIVGIKRFETPRELEIKWENESIDLYPEDAASRKTFVKECRKSFWNQSPLNGTWWDHLFVEERSHELVTVLIPHPVQIEWVKHHPSNCFYS